MAAPEPRTGSASGKHPRRGWLSPVEWTCVLYLVAIGACWLLIARYGDRWWPATVLMFGPRWMAALPAVLLVPWTLARRRWLALPILAVAVLAVAGPIMGWRWGSSFAETSSRDLRVVTLNIGNGPREGEIRVQPGHLFRLYEIAQPDVMVLQECGLEKQQLLSYFPDAMLHSKGESCVISRLPILRIDTRDPDDMSARGAKGLAERIQVLTRRGPVNIVNLHLTTVRWGLDRVAARGDNATLRRLESAVAATWMTRVIGNDPARLPLVVVGDFNMPVESAIYRRYWGGMQNSFSECGHGYGYTRIENRFSVRIDHVLHDRSSQCVKAVADRALGGDRRAVVVDLKLR